MEVTEGSVTVLFFILGVTIGFDPISYTVMETAGNARLRITKEGQIDRPFTFMFLTQDYLASSAGMPRS